MKRVFLWVFFVLGIVVGTLGTLVWQLRAKSSRASCYSNLLALNDSLSAYSLKHSGAFPSNMVSLKDHGASGEAGNADEWTNYIYLSWSVSTNAEHYAMAYDRRMSNHRGKGVHVVLVNGAVFWDSGGNWLRQFARTHPELKIELPEDLK